MNRVCILTSTLDDPRIYHKQARTLADAGYDVRLIAHHTRRETNSGVQIIPVAPSRSRWAQFGDLFRIYRTAREMDADIYHFHDPFLMPFAAKLQDPDTAVVYDCHEVYSTQLQWYDFPPNLLNPLVDRFYNAVEAHYATEYDATVAVTEWMHARFIDSGYAAPHLVRNFPILGQIDADVGSIDRPHEFMLVYVGGITEPRGIAQMLAALAGARSAGIDAGLWLIGAADGAATELIEDHADHSSVHHLGRLPYADVFPYLAAADVGLALLDPRMYGRGIPTKLFEYMACSIPVIASETRANRAYVDAAYGFVVPYEDTRATVNAISMLAEESDTCDRMGAAGRAAVEDRYSWEQEQSRLLDLYDHICDSIA